MWMPINKLRMEDKRKHHHFIFLKIMMDMKIMLNSKIMMNMIMTNHDGDIHDERANDNDDDDHDNPPETFFLLGRQHWGRILSVHTHQGRPDLMMMISFSVKRFALVQ